MTILGQTCHTETQKEHIGSCSDGGIGGGTVFVTYTVDVLDGEVGGRGCLGLIICLGTIIIHFITQQVP